MKRSLILAFLLLGFTILLKAGIITRDYYFSKYTVSQKGEYQMVNLDDAQLSGLPGFPALAYRQLNILLPPGESAISIEMTGYDKIELPGVYKLFPQQNVQPYSKGASGNFIRNEAFYDSDVTYPASAFGKLITSFFCGHSFALSTFTPMQYNPGSGKVSYYRKVSIKIQTAPTAEAASAFANFRQSGTITSEIQHLADNPEMMDAYQTDQPSTAGDYEMLIITTAAFAGSFGTLQSDYLKEGIRSEVKTVEDISASISGNDIQEKMRNYIIEQYQQHGIEYVLLGGDDELVPHRGFYCFVQSSSVYEDWNIPSDLYYSSLDGNWNTDGDNQWAEPGEDDLLPELAVARFSFSNQTELQNMLHKSHSYQFAPVAGELRKILMAGEYLYSNPETWGSDYLELLIGQHNDNGYTTNGMPVSYSYDKMYDENANWSGVDLINHLNLGAAMLQHSGHANETYVMKLSNGDITDANFYNVNGIAHNYPVIYTHGCLCGAFDYNDCIAEKMVSISNFAAAFVGNSRYGWFNEGQTEGPSAHLHREFVDALFNDSLCRLGRAHMESKIQTASWVTAPGQWEPGAIRWCFYDCNALGDPAMAIWTDNPVSFTTTYPATLPLGTPSMNVHVSSAGVPLHNLNCVVLQDSTLIGKAVTDYEGNAVITFDPLVQAPVTVQLIVSGINCLPATYTIQFVATASPYVVYATHSIDDASGNANGEADFGESLLLSLGMRNTGLGDANNVPVILTTADPYATVTDTAEIYPFIAAGDTVTIQDGYGLQVFSNIPDQHTIYVNVKAISGGSNFYSLFPVLVNAPHLTAGSLLIDDVVGGNGNHRLDPGEDVILKITATNDGHCVSSGVNASLHSLSPFIEFTDTLQSLPALSIGESHVFTYAAHVSDQAPKGAVIDLKFSISSGAYSATASYYPVAGLIVEDFETGNFNQFSWNNSWSKPWTTVNSGPFEGFYSAKSADIVNSESSVISIMLNVLADDSISFYSKVSSEEFFDFLRFYIDTQKVEEWSGELGWQKHVYPVGPGWHTFKWAYDKDWMTSAGTDCAMLDFIVFPAFDNSVSTPELLSSSDGINIFPNPVKERLTILQDVGFGKDCNVEILNSTGMLIRHKGNIDLSSGTLILDVNELTSGIYLLKVTGNQHSRSVHFVVAR
ncbi:MAG: T9SS type A sorting domain-containing protein [Bacteroidetes bacterium]|nr:T9SS type A sorting domain-containing protein [Bacteroidota bacterium]